MVLTQRLHCNLTDGTMCPPRPNMRLIELEFVRTIYSSLDLNE